MIGETLLLNVWFSMLLWGLVYLSDYYLTIYSARMFRTQLQEHITFEGSFELTPVFQKDVDRLRLVSPNFLIRWGVSLLAIPLIAWLSLRVIYFPLLYIFFLGALLLREVPVHFRHARNIALARLTRTGAGMRGKIEYSRWLNLRLSSVEFIAFGLFFLVLTVGWESWFFLGGAVSCLGIGLQHWVWSSKLIAAVQHSQA